jgi:pyrroline-5-carboxylate reductase
MNSEKMAIIGIGVMGKAILIGILKKGLISPQNISDYVPMPTKYGLLMRKWESMLRTAGQTDP